MPKQLDPAIGDILKQHGFGIDAVWDCHGTWVVYHHVLEKIAAASGIEFSPPQIVEADGANKVAAMAVVGKMDDRTEWSIGEASPANCKNAYPWAMAEKRAKDRVVLKLIGLAGLAYSEEEADDFKEAKPQTAPVEEFWGGPLNKTEFKAALRDFVRDIESCDDGDQLLALLNAEESMALMSQCQSDAPSWWVTKQGSDILGLAERIENRKTELQQKDAA